MKVAQEEFVHFDLVVVGGGAAGFFGAIAAAEMKPGLSILILEKTTKLLSKVRVSGGGRCNVTHHCFEATPLSKHFPRGSKELKLLFRKFQAKDVVEWFESKNVKLKTEEDGRMFPVTNNSQTIIDCFLNETDRHQIKIKLHSEVKKINPNENDFTLQLNTETIIATKLLIHTTHNTTLHHYDHQKP